MTCKDVTSAIDLRQKPSTLILRFRIHIHLALCEACHRYNKMTKALRSAIAKSTNKDSTVVDLESLNKELLVKHSRESH